MWDIIVALIVGAAIPIIIQYIQTKEKQKYFEIERKEKFKLVAIEKRIDAHQQALKYWERMRSVIHKSDEDTEKLKIINEANQFWLDNSLYLEKETRSKFRDAIWIVSSYRLWVDNYRDMEKGEEKQEEKKYYMERWSDYHKIFEIIQKEVELEPIKAIEDKTPEGEDIQKSSRKK